MVKTQTNTFTLKNSRAFSGFSVDNLEKAKAFYGEILGLDVREENGMGLSLHLAGGTYIFIYPKKNHIPATFTILNFPVENIDQTLAQLIECGIKPEHYENLGQDEKWISRGRGSGQGPDIAWFKDPAGNILSILQE